MSFPEAMMYDRIWFDRPKYVEAREHYELFLTNNLTLEVSKSHEPILSKETKAVAKVWHSNLKYPPDFRNFYNQVKRNVQLSFFFQTIAL